ncbi:CPBP family intramembrane metalloprotease [Undibacterium sp. Jales W-56]|uniref:CPBP family intramembrane glutamic endopeptidase n=1 Tax=Undibacterium sp. Jales W-56 TaxID=2897325 RepID=UPI0021CE825A|nr:CPBP family intramembrane glutamic endopeptidase [Undibacterium sp. Jales W-56]MCU6434210.1 CPBP family intramembrane metalloprotease [Undibacterium sp. Jales W-56]
MPVIFYLFCATSMIWLCLPRPRAWLGMFILTMTWAMYAAHIAPVGLAMIILMAAVGWGAARANGIDRKILLLLTGLSGLLLASHRLPGFAEIVLTGLPPFTVSPATTFYLHLDKAIAGLLMLAVFCRSDRSQHLATWRDRGLWRLMAISLPLIFVVALALGLTAPQWKWPASTYLFFSVNLFFTCLAEEAFFRAGVQQALLALMPRRPWFGIGLAALLFGLAHAAGGWRLIVVATLAGVCYGLAYHRTRAIAAAILLHFLVNAIHFVGFVYPAILH